jgi:hypothetical protein
MQEMAFAIAIAIDGWMIEDEVSRLNSITQHIESHFRNDSRYL